MIAKKISGMTKENFLSVIDDIIIGISCPLFRGLGSESFENYNDLGTLLPQNGSLSVGKGVFFTNDLKYAMDFAKKCLLITSLNIINPYDFVVDTRVEGYSKFAKYKLDKTLGKDNYDGYRLWDEILKNDTITYEGGPKDRFVYTKRSPVLREEILIEICLC